MRIVSVSEDRKIEKRIAITPEIVKKYTSIGLEVSLSQNYADHLGIKDSEFTELGAKSLLDRLDIDACETMEPEIEAKSWIASWQNAVSSAIEA